MTYKFFLTKLAAEDIERSIRYITTELAAPSAGRNLFLEIEKAVTAITSFPFAYEDCYCYLIPDKNIRHIKVKNYILIYYADADHKSITILRFLHSLQDIQKIMQQ